MESSMNLYLSSEAFWNAHLHKVAEHSATVRPVQHVDVVGATFKFVKINSKKIMIFNNLNMKPLTRPSLELFFLNFHF